jgi:hypothetical protein
LEAAVRAGIRRLRALGPISFDARGDLRRGPVAILRARRGGGSRVVLATEGATLIAVR